MKTTTMNRVCQLGLLSLLAGCGAASTAESNTTLQAASPMAAYQEEFEGTVEMFAPDGVTPIQPAAPSRIVREVMPAEGQIIETVVQGEERHRAVLTRQGESNVFDATDDAHSFTGTITYEGPDWHWTSWTYALTMTESGLILRGTGRLDGETLETSKELAPPGAPPVVVIHEHYRRQPAAAPGTAATP